LAGLLSTPGALDALRRTDQDAWQFIGRHVAGAWGELDEHDRRENELSVKEGLRLLSAYQLSDGTKIWIITEADRSLCRLILVNGLTRLKTEGYMSGSVHSI
jgi:hypothetical protein